MMARPTPDARLRSRSIRRSWTTLVGLVLVPVIIAMAFAWGLHRPADNLDRIQAAVVNLDEPAKVGKQTLPLGRQVVAALTAGVGLDGRPLREDQPNLSWTLSDTANAQAGLEDGSYAAVVTIPKSFSSDATSLSSSDTDKIGQADLQVTTSKNAAISDAAVARLVSTVVSSTLGQQITKTYVDNIYVSFSTLHDAAAKAAKGAGDLHEGSAALVEGTEAADQGADDLVSGLTQLKTGAAGLDDGSADLATGAQDSATGASTLSDGLDQLNQATTDLPVQTKKLAHGASAVADGDATLSTSLSSLSEGLGTASDGVQDLPAAADQLAYGATQVDTAISSVDEGADRLQTATRQALKTCQADPRADCGDLEHLAAAAKDLATGTGQLADGTGQVAAGATALADQAQPLVDGIDAAADGAQQAAHGAKTLSAASRQVAGGATTLAKAAPALADGVSQAADGASDLQQGDAQLATGAHTLATGAAKVSDGTDDAAAGAKTLAEGTTKLEDGATKLDDGSKSLITGLKRIAKQIPDYDTAQRDTVADTASNPVTSTASKDTTLDGALTYLSALALAISALVTYLLLAAIPRGALSSRAGAARLTLRTFTPAALVATAQAVLVAVVLRSALDISSGRSAGVAGIAFLGGLVLNAVNQALVAWLGGVGRLISLAALAVSAPAALISTVPPVFTTATTATPLQPLTEALRQTVVAGTAPGGAIAALVSWLLAGLLLTTLATARSRSVQYRQLIAVPAT